jgi:hypothetical protein
MSENLSRRVSGKEHEARLLSEEQPANLALVAGRSLQFRGTRTSINLHGPVRAHRPGLPAVKTAPSLPTEG